MYVICVDRYSYNGAFSSSFDRLVGNNFYVDKESAWRYLLLFYAADRSWQKDVIEETTEDYMEKSYTDSYGKTVFTIRKLEEA